MTGWFNNVFLIQVSFNIKKMIQENLF